MKILIACEESQTICTAFREKGFEAYSCDIIDCSGGHPEWHIKGDALNVINGNCSFLTQDGSMHTIHDEWSLVIAHPPCTDLSVSGAKYFEQKRADGRQRKSIEFFISMMNAKCNHICVENPVNIISGKYVKNWFPDLCDKYKLPIKPSQIIQPYMFGHAESKSTCLWLKNLPFLTPTDIVQKPESGYWENQTPDKQNKLIIDGKWIGYNDPRTAINRSKTYKGIRKAIADQWGDYLLSELNSID